MSDRAALKKTVHDRLMSLEEAELATAIAHYEAFLQNSQLDAREVHDKDDIVASRENADLAAAFDTPVQTHHAKIDAIENTDFSLVDVVGPGAVVMFSDRRFIVCVSTTRFDVDGITYMGISTQSPIYRAMAGLEAGESFSFNGRELEIQDVL
jgi:transcription elongation GreA/GreB family factor